MAKSISPEASWAVTDRLVLAGVELVALVWAVALAVLARWIWRQREKKSL